MRIYGHRGARAEAPETTLAGFRRAIEAGVRRVELDLHLARDGELVVIHDETLERTTDGHGPVSALGSAELARLDARRGGPGWPRPVGVPTIDAVLDACPELEHVQLECKPADAAQRTQVASRLSRLFRSRALHARATVTSFDPELLRAVRAADASIPLALVTDRAQPDPVKFALELGAHLLVVHYKLGGATRIRAAHAAGLEVSAWTVNEREIALRLRDAGIDSIITDYPSRFVALGTG